MDINAHTELYCILGNPVRHSLSPLMHNAAFLASGINAVYLAFQPDSFPEAMLALKTLGIKGASVTVPFKIDALKYADEADALARDIGSANTLVNEAGRFKAYNTDGAGAVTAVEEAGIRAAGTKFLIIGNGGSARAVAFALLHKGARILLAGRNQARIEALAGDLSKRFPAVEAITLERLDAAIMSGVDVVINTTPVGMHPDIESAPIDCRLLDSRLAVFDIIYAPHETALLKEAARRGCRRIFGIDMLINQGALQFALWTGQPPPVQIYKKVILDFMNTGPVAE